MLTDINTAQLVLIEWDDSRRPAAEWRFLSEVSAPSPVKCLSVGWEIHDGSVIILAPNVGDVGHSDPQVSGIIEIPARAVTKRTVLIPAP